ncbi:MAG: FAD-dependent oxidoreductase [Candidatus Omnitrophica bacterium]|nr:FAD-dependent oxidoreductase [Candidatus Omnitrophota bacterium]
MNKKVIILGAGLAGLSAAYHNSNGACVYEQNQEIGGLARSSRINGFIFDYDGHLLHFKTSYVKKLINKLIPGLLLKHKRDAWIFSHEVYTRYPFQANTFGLPAQIVKECIMGMANTETGADSDNGAMDLKSWMIKNFGTGITKHFLYPYNHKFWTLPPEELISDWTKGYVPTVKFKDVLDGAFTLKTKPLGYNSEFWYPRQGGIEQVPQAFARRIKNIKTNCKLKAVDINKKRLYFENGETDDYDCLVSTIALVELKRMIISSLPAIIKEAFSRLKFISIYNLNLGINRDAVSKRHWIYFPENKFCFFRVGFPMNFSEDAAPQGKSSMYIEISYSEFASLKKENIEKKIIQDLKMAGLLHKDDKIIARHLNNIKYGYVIYDKNYHESISLINNFFEENNIFLCGRFGRWKYMSMEDAILDGKLVSDKIGLL